jgi:recombination protein RecR
MTLPPALEELITQLAKLPGIGRKTAQRLAMHLLRGSREDAVALAKAAVGVKDRIHLCSECGNFTEEDLCEFCRSPKRDRGVICVVEEAGDILLLEATGGCNGLYHVLGGALSPLDGIGPEDIRMKELEDRVKKGVREVIVATNPSVEGDATALYIAKVLKPLGIKVSRIARGVPVGSDLEHVDQVTLARALEGRGEV